jgi:hypothetical protein
MAQTQEAVRRAEAVYTLEGTLIEACSCNVLCPCWIGEDPDLGECFAIVAYHIDTGQVTGLEVSGRSVVLITHIPGNVLAGDWEVVVLVDDQADATQRDALVKVFSGQLGGPLADFAQLIGTVKGVESVPISHRVRGGTGTPWRSPASSRPRWSPTAARRGRSRPCGTRSSPPSPGRPPGCPRRPATGCACPGTA